MIILLSPAKSFYNEAFTRPYPAQLAVSQPVFGTETERLVKTLQRYSVKKLKELMHISDDIAQLNVQRYAQWSPQPNSTNAQPAVLAFNGEAYRGLAATEFTTKELAFAQAHLRILSGMYGVLKPLDLIQAYRLEMGTKLKMGSHKNLYQFWGDKIAKHLEAETGNTGTIINLASNEYAKAAKLTSLKARVITPVFKDFSKGSYKVLMTYAKNARGSMARYIITNQLTNPELLKGFDTNGYAYHPAQSDESTWVFTRG